MGWPSRMFYGTGGDAPAARRPRGGAPSRVFNAASNARAWTLGLAILASAMLPVAAAQGKTVKLLALGDSLTAGYGLAEADAFPQQLERRLKAAGFDVTVMNAGVSGDTSAGGPAVLDWVLADQPDAAIVALGGNDALRGLDPEATYANLDRILARLAEKHVAVLLVGMKAPRNLGKDYAAAFDAVYPRLAERWQVPLYPFMLDGVALDAELNQPDGIHPNAKGVAVEVERMLPAIRHLIEEIG